MVSRKSNHPCLAKRHASHEEYIFFSSLAFILYLTCIFASKHPYTREGCKFKTWKKSNLDTHIWGEYVFFSLIIRAQTTGAKDGAQDTSRASGKFYILFVFFTLLTFCYRTTCTMTTITTTMPIFHHHCPFLTTTAFFSPPLPFSHHHRPFFTTTALFSPPLPFSHHHCPFSTALFPPPPPPPPQNMGRDII